MKEFARLFPRALLTVFAPRYLAYHLAAVVLTWLIITTGFDWYYFEAIRNSSYYLVFVYLSLAAGMVGFFLPLTLPIITVAVGYIKRDYKLIYTAFAIATAGFVVSIVAGGYKALTGRAHPLLWDAGPLRDTTHDFAFGLFNNGIFWGWPSSHTAVAFAMSVTLFILYRRNRTFGLFMLLYALLIGIGVSFAFHWFSDFIAGIIIGSIVGKVVGTLYLKHHPTFTRHTS